MVTREGANTILRSVIRSIDKQAEFSTNLVEGERAGVEVTLSLRKRSTTITIPEETLNAAAGDSMRRNQLRTTLKRALDRVCFTPTPIASTKMLRPTTQSDGFFRPPSGGRGRR